MRTRIGPIETLGHACEARRNLWVLCRGCGHSVRLDPRNLMALRGDITLRQVRSQFKCRRCRKSQAAIVLDHDEWPGRD